ncbi:MAG TPA: addiction module protein [Pyrinomonadaceae bacterium]|jgi:hypothetical protein
MDLNAIEQEALNLDLKSRGRLAARLLESLDELSNKESDYLWAEEALRRAREMEAGDDPGTPLENVLQNLRARHR